MENEFYSSAAIPPPLHFESSTLMPTWQAISAAMEIQAASELNCSSNPSPDCFYNPNIDRINNFDSAFSSMVSSPVASNSNITHENFAIRELIGKLGNIGNSAELSPHSQPLLVNSQTSLGTTASASYINGGNSSRNTSCYNTPLNSPPKLNLSLMDQLAKETKISSLPLNSTVGEFSADPGFIERAAKFSCFGSRSFNGRTSQLGFNSSELPKNRSNPLMYSGKLPRVSSSPSLEALGSQMGLQENRTITRLANSQEESTLSEQNPIGDSNLKPTNDINSRKRKAVSKGKSKETPVSSPSANGTTKVAETNGLTNAKRCKSNERNGNKNEKEANNKTEEDNKGRTNSTGDDKTSPNPPEPLKDYIHVRARRGQATDSHSLAERVRREKISERMKLLQDLVPSCNKVTGKALMLDEIINYVQSLQRQVEFLSMKLSSVNTRLDFNMDTLMSKEMFQTNNTLPQQIFPSDSSAQAIYGHQTQQNPQLHSNISNGPVNDFSVDPLDSALSHLPPLNGFSESVSQYPTFGEDDLQTLVQMGFGQNPNRESALQSQNFQGLDQKSDMKIEL